MIYQFGPFELDLSTVELRVDGKPCSLEPQVFALLALLVENRDRLVSKDEMIEKVWDSAESLSNNIGRMRNVAGRDS